MNSGRRSRTTHDHRWMGYLRSSDLTKLNFEKAKLEREEAESKQAKSVLRNSSICVCVCVSMCFSRDRASSQLRLLFVSAI